MTSKNNTSLSTNIDTQVNCSTSKPQTTLDRRFSVAPMMDWSDRHCRYFWRLMSRHAVLYTEMVTTGALIHGDRERFLNFNIEEQPLALQLGGSNAKELVLCAKMAEEWGYNEVNLNCGCPSDRVQNGMIGACLMAHPKKVADGLKAMQDAVSIPVTVKHRIGIDDMDDYAELEEFVLQSANKGIQTFIVHARKAWLQGLSPKQNRDKPPLNYERVYRLKAEHPELEIIINGGITDIAQCLTHLEQVDGVMVGREAYHNPYLLAEVDQKIYGDSHSSLTRAETIRAFMKYIEMELTRGTRLHHMTRHILGMYQGVRGAKQFRRHISENAYKDCAGVQVLADAFTFINE